MIGYSPNNGCDEYASVWYWRRKAAGDARNGMSGVARRSGAANARRKPRAAVTNAQTRLRKRWSRQGCLYGVELGLFSPRILPSAIRIRAMRGPRDLYGEFSVGDGGNSSAGAVEAGNDFMGAAGTLAGVTGVFVAGAVFARFRRLRDFPPSRTMRPYSATRARLVLTPCCCSSSATDL